MNGNPRDSRPLSAEEIATSPVIMEPGQDEAERINRGGAPVIEENGKKKRRTNGVMLGAAMSVPGIGDGALVCEGAEDGMTLGQATRQHVRIAFGKSAMGAVPLPDGEPVVIVADNDKAGIEGAHVAAAMLIERGHAVKIVVPPDGVKDANELLIKQGAEAVRGMVAAAAPFETMPDDNPEDGSEADDDIDAEIKRLARLKPIEYEKVGKEAAARLGIRASVLDKVVSAARPHEVSPGSGRPLTFDESEPWPEAVDGALRLSGISDAIRKFVVLAPTDADTVALWVTHTHSTHF